jgi:MOSC domain-containing protein YiiM
VVKPGEIAAGTPIELVSRPRPTWTIARASKLLYHEPDNVPDMEDLANLPELSRAWREELFERIARRGT